MKLKHPGKSNPQLLDLIFQRARDLQALLKDPYESPLLLQDCIIRAVKDEPFYTPLITTTIPQDPNALHTRLHQCLRQQDSISSNSQEPSKSSMYFVDPENENEENFEVCYNENGTPFFRRRIMRGSSSFSTPDYRNRSWNVGFPRRSGFRGRPYRVPRYGQRRVSFAPIKNAADSSGRTMLCRFCNSWFHMERNCPDKPSHNTNLLETSDTLDQYEIPFIAENQSEYNPTLHIDRSVGDYNITPPTATDREDKNQDSEFNTLFINLACKMDYEINNQSNEYYQHNIKSLPPDIRGIRSQLPNVKLDDQVPFHGFCLDEGAPHSVTGLNQWLAYLRKYHLPAQLKRVRMHKASISFGGQGPNRVQVNALGSIIIRVPLPAHCYFDYKSLLISNDVPMLLGVATQTKLKAVTIKDCKHPTVNFRTIGVTLPLKLKFKHLYYEAPDTDDYLFAMSELAQIHRNLGHAPAGSVYSALRRAYPIETGASDLEKLQAVAAQCKDCQLFSRQPNRYRAVLPEQFVFNYDVALDVMFIAGHPILHTVCRQTHFSRAAPLPQQDSYTIWVTFMTIWVVPYLGVPFNLWVDQAKAFLSVQFKTLANSLGCNLVPIAVEAHWSLIAERYHDPLRRISMNLITDHPAAPLQLIIDYANLAMSHTIGPEGFTPAILAFGAQPRLLVGNYKQQPQTVTNRMDLMTTARREYESIVSQLRIRKALHTNLPNEQAQHLTPGTEVLVYREKRGWDGMGRTLFCITMDVYLLC